MLDSRSLWSASNHDDVWELIPWYVNGSLPPEDMTVIQRHISGCAQCTAEVSRQRGLARQVVDDASDATSTSRSWKKLKRQIELERDGRAQRSGILRWPGGIRGGLILGGACVAACLLAIVAMRPTANDIHDVRALTGTLPTGSRSIKFQAVSGLAPGQLEAILTEHGLELRGGPSEAGVYTAVSIRAGADPQTLSQSLMKAPQIIFATPSD